MQELEKILEEVNRRINEYVDHDYVRGSGDVVKGLSIAKSIVRKHMNDGWIPVEERLPERTLDEKIKGSYQKYLVFIDGVDGWDIDIAVYDFWNDKNGVKLMMDMERLKTLSHGVLFQIHTDRKGARENE